MAILIQDLFQKIFQLCQKILLDALLLMGNGTSGSYGRPLHSADYDFNDELLVKGSSYWVELAEQQLKI
jgi:hippurate hydrolase